MFCLGDNMLKIVKSKKHKGTNFLYDTEKLEYIAKVYDIPNREDITQAFITAYHDLERNKNG
jgi:hypothetical protein